uniref:Uncharacterized protein n=1 Tax=Ralstonia solanacearum TaxID=305 RepID=A0A0S4UJT1_RALSL|nr:protein of unknown function [Ralstonia solanacearum]CUV33287.1 protein of unknown function [Ralstonia solanacearum]CUV40567.1 protein of unknown function [Ralstonia solanacearum]CUV60963.1 protein of unknown function [Ralstonia solanacearum]
MRSDADFECANIGAVLTLVVGTGDGASSRMPKRL